MAVPSRSISCPSGLRLSVGSPGSPLSPHHTCPLAQAERVPPRTVLLNSALGSSPGHTQEGEARMHPVPASGRLALRHRCPAMVTPS